MASQRLTKELNRFQEHPLEGCSFELVDGSFFHWHVQMIGPDGTPYAGGKFELKVMFPHRTPYDGPDVVFRTPIFHM